MKIYQYLNLPEPEQYQTVWDIGTHVDNVVLDEVVYQLYAVNDFFVEIQYSVDDNRILGKQEFKDSESLDKYLSSRNNLDNLLQA